ncbi:MAG: hypothetical protein QMD61_09120 [Methanobacterium sp.]|nr:hypothetical protein [Methanobacterium sp.]
MRIDNRGLASAELLFVTLIFLIMAGGLINLASSGMDITETGNLGEVRMIGERIAEVINTAYINGNGYSINMSLPNDFNYTACINSSGFINMKYNNQNITVKVLPVDKIQDITMTNGQRYAVKNNNGTITFTLI